LTEPSDASKRAVDKALEHAGLIYPYIVLVSKPLLHRSTRRRSSPRTGARASTISSTTGRGGHRADRNRGEVASPWRGLDRGELCDVDGEEVWLINSHIPEYSHGNRLNHQPRRRASCC
jgi:hypothetical protein